MADDPRLLAGPVSPWPSRTGPPPWPPSRCGSSRPGEWSRVGRLSGARVAGSAGRVPSAALASRGGTVGAATPRAAHGTVTSRREYEATSGGQAGRQPPDVPDEGKAARWRRRRRTTPLFTGISIGAYGALATPAGFRYALDAPTGLLPLDIGHDREGRTGRRGGRPPSERPSQDPRLAQRSRWRMLTSSLADPPMTAIPTRPSRSSMGPIRDARMRSRWSSPACPGRAGAAPRNRRSEPERGLSPALVQAEASLGNQ